MHVYLERRWKECAVGGRGSAQVEGALAHFDILKSQSY